ncbi:MAG: hypothetical protein HY924_12100 [Elusimicrobia bacterium]|nr:hypothetical protein [Elusimicrobiota bacterium]
MPTEFSETLVSLRKAADFPSAYAFFHDNGGKPVFKISCRKYQLIEKGENLPKPQRLALFISLLRHPLGSPEAARLVAAWLRTLVGPEVFASLFAPLLRPGAGSGGPTAAREVMSRSLRGRRTTITPAQYALIAKSFEHYWVHTVLSDSSEGSDARALARCLRSPEAKVRKALSELERAGLVHEAGKGVFRSALFGRVHVSPSLSATPSLRRKTADYVRRMERSGQVCAGRRLIMHADEAEFGQFLSFFVDSVRAAQAYIDPARSSRSAFFMVEGKVVKLFPF